jgi:hypothetical protein
MVDDMPASTFEVVFLFYRFTVNWLLWTKNSQGKLASLLKTVRESQRAAKSFGTRVDAAPFFESSIQHETATSRVQESLKKILETVSP